MRAELQLKHPQAPTVNPELTAQMPNLGAELTLVLIPALKINAGSDWILFRGGNISSNHATITLKSKISSNRGPGTNKQMEVVYSWCISVSRSFSKVSPTLTLIFLQINLIFIWKHP